VISWHTCPYLERQMTRYSTCSHSFDTAVDATRVTCDNRDWKVRFEIFTAVNMKNVVFWGIKAQFVPHRRHITSPLRVQPVNAM
jgi:hypothetical protein